MPPYIVFSKVCFVSLMDDRQPTNVLALCGSPSASVDPSSFSYLSWGPCPIDWPARILSLLEKGCRGSLASIPRVPKAA